MLFTSFSNAASIAGQIEDSFVSSALSEYFFDRIPLDDCVKVLDVSGVLSFSGVVDPRPAALLGLGIETLPSHLATLPSEPHPVVIAG